MTKEKRNQPKAAPAKKPSKKVGVKKEVARAAKGPARGKLRRIVRMNPDEKKLAGTLSLKLKKGKREGKPLVLAQARTGKKDVVERTEKAKVEKPLSAEKATSVFREPESKIVTNPDIEEAVVKSFKEDSFETKGLTEAEIKSEVEDRVIRAKAEQIGERVLIPGKEGKPGMTEGQYIEKLAKDHDIDPNTLLIARAKNQAGIGAEVDKENTITDPEAYKQSLETFAQNFKKAQDYIAANKDLIAQNPDIQARAMAILQGKDPNDLSPEAQAKLRTQIATDERLGEQFSTLNRMTTGNTSSLNNIGSGIGTVSLDPADLNATPPLDQKKYAPGSAEAQQLFAKAARDNGMPEEWGKSPGLHSVLGKESGGIVGRLNYTFKAVAKRMGTSVDDPKFVGWVHGKLRSGASAKDFGIRSTATGLGQLLIGNVKKHYPGGISEIGKPEGEAAGMLAYMKSRYGTPDNAAAKYGKMGHEGY